MADISIASATSQAALMGQGSNSGPYWIDTLTAISCYSDDLGQVP